MTKFNLQLFAGATRPTTPSKSQSFTYEAAGMAEDLSPIVVNIDPTMTQMFSNISETDDALATSFGGFTEGLRPPTVNAHYEKEDYVSEKIGSIAPWENNIQTFINTYFITNTQEKVKKVYNSKSEKARQIHNAFLGHARDLEYAIVLNTQRRVESPNVNPALTGGTPYFLSRDEVAVDIDTTTGVVTCTAEHYLTTGDFIYFIAKDMPPELEVALPYYVRLEAVGGDKKFTIYNDIKSACEKIDAQQVKPTDTGVEVKIVKNNVISCADKRSFTLQDIDDVLQMAYSRGGSPTDMFMSGRNKRKFNAMVSGLATTNRNAKDRYMSTVQNAYESEFGVVNAKTHRLYSDYRVDILDMQYWGHKFFERTKSKELPIKGNYSEWAVETQWGLSCTQPKASASIVDIKR